MCQALAARGCSVVGFEVVFDGYPRVTIVYPSPTTELIEIQEFDRTDVLTSFRGQLPAYPTVDILWHLFVPLRSISRRLRRHPLRGLTDA